MIQLARLLPCLSLLLVAAADLALAQDHNRRESPFGALRWN